MPIDKNADNIQVMVRVRPFNSREKEEDSKACIRLDESSLGCLLIDSKPDPKKFFFDWVGGENTTQQTIFKTVGEPMVAACLEGFNCCIFAYGQTGAGKTFTMQGKGLDDTSDIHSRGLQPRVFDFIFKKVKEEMQSNEHEYLIKCCYLEIYNESIRDLFDTSINSLQIREDIKKGIYVEGLKEETVSSSDQTLELLRRGARNRHVGATQMNAESSRSHSVFSMTIESKRAYDGIVKMKSSKFHFVDLAGSERQKSTAATGDRLKEAGNINKSLTVLGKVISTLVEAANGKSVHVAYRESKLTHLLKDSLGGNSKTCIIANVSPSSSSYQETLTTLQFAQRAKMIKNRASINEDSQGGLEGLKNEIKRLKDELLLANVKISNLQKDQNQSQLRSPKWTPQKNALSELQILDFNQRLLSTEIVLKDSLSFLKDNEVLLETELAKKEEYIKIFQSAAEFYNSNELQYKTIITLQSERNQRYKETFDCHTQYIDITSVISNENSLLRKENFSYLEIIRNTPAVITTFIENVSLKEALDEREGSANPNSSLSVAIQLQENLFFLQDLSTKLEENIKERKILSNHIKKLTGVQGLVSPTTDRERDDLEKQLTQVKQQMGAQIESMNFEISSFTKRSLSLKGSWQSKRRNRIDLHKSMRS